MRIRLTKISDTRHALECIRDDGSVERAELESKTFLFHDLTHFAVETEAELRDSFWGLVASGHTFEQLKDEAPENMGAASSREIAMTEIAVSAIGGVVQGLATPEGAVAGLQNLFSAQHKTLPAWLTAGFALRVQERMRRLLGEWRSLPYGETMKLTFTSS